jgi:hypothetical protein
MNARRLTSTTLASICAPVAFLLLAATPVEALVTHDYLPAVSAAINEGIPAEGPHGEKIAVPGKIEGYGISMTVDSGHLWTVEGEDRVDEFDAATGAFLAQPIVNPEHVAFGVGSDATAGVAVGHAAGKTQVYLGERTSGVPAVGVYSESGALTATWTGVATPAGSFSSEELDVAIDDSTDALDEDKGDVYVASHGQFGAPGVVDVFHPEADGKEHYVGQITGPSPSKPFANVNKVAVNAANGDVAVLAEGTLFVFEPTALGEYALTSEIPRPGESGEAFNLAIDSSSGEIYIDELADETFGAVIDEYSPSGAYLGRITGADTPHGEIKSAFAVAVDPESHNVYVGEDQFSEIDAFGPDIVFPDVTTGAASNVTASSVTLNGTVDPHEAGAATCLFEWGTGKAFGKTAPCEPEGVAEGNSPVAVHADLSGLPSDTTYFYRLQATNANGTNPGEPSQDQEVTTAGPGISETSVTDLAATSVTFEASINPHKVPTRVYFQYGPSSAYGSDVPAAPGEAIGGGEGYVNVTPHHVQELTAASTYHFRVVVVTEPSPGDEVVFYGADQVFTTQGVAVPELPDGRQWEMVSPPDKKGARIYTYGEFGIAQAAADGDAFTYRTDNPTESEPHGFSYQMQVLSSRGAAGWTTNDLALPHDDVTGPSIGQGDEYRLFSPDLSLAVVQPFGNFIPELSAEASEATAMLRSLNPACGSSCYRPLVTGKLGFANVPPGTVFGEEPDGECPDIYCGPEVIGATPDLSHIVLQGTGLGGQYEWSEGKLTRIDEDGASEPILTAPRNVRGAISSDGSRVILEESSAKTLYMRDLPSEKTIALNVAEPSCIAHGKCASGGGTFQLANTDGSEVFFTNRVGSKEPHRLTAGSGEVGQDLYECEMLERAGELECNLSDVAKDAMGVLGASEDGSYLYFVANSVLAGGAVPGECEPEEGRPSPTATCNLYVRHGGVTKLVALLSPEDSHDWTSDLSEATARVSPDGNWLEFMSQRSVTGYDNRDAITGKPDAEVYLYDASTGRVVCASCDPTGARPIGVEASQLEAGLVGGRGIWVPHVGIAANVPTWERMQIGNTANQPRYLSNSGRLFFNSSDSLVPQDVNGTEDVYEYEPPGVGGCTDASASFRATSGGCIGLISSGTSAEESSFQEASESGGDVFFLTYSQLQPQDYDNAIDVYDAHECTSAAPCFTVPVPQPPACTTADACRAAPTPQPANFGAPSSATFTGAGNLPPATGTGATTKPLTRAQKLAQALKACRKKSKKRKRAVCERQARIKYGAKSSKAAAKKKGKR